MRSRLGIVARSGASGVIITLTTNQTNYSLFTAAGSPVVATSVTLTINSGVVVYSTSTSTPALDLSGFPSGSTITVINNGSIIGKGGNGGGGGGGDTGTSGRAAGSAGGNAIKLGTNNVTINNASGSIFGGGGGGGGGTGVNSQTGSGAKYDPILDHWNGGGGGGGGQSYSATSGGAGGAAGTGGSSGSAGGGGSNSAAGTGGAGAGSGTTGGAGGGYGAAGSASGASGGAAGKAVDLNGRSVTWTAGNNGTQVKGAVS